MAFHYENIPAELKRLKQWVCWGGDKLPKNAMTGGNAMSNNPSTWSDYKTAVEAIDKYGFQGIGFMFAPPYFGVDLDKCIDDVDFVDEFVHGLQSYAEYSKSGNGIHIICKGELPQGPRRRGKVEMYSEGRYFICTGNLYSDIKEIRDCTEAIKVLHSKYLPDSAPASIKRADVMRLELPDQDVIDKARGCKTGMAFQALYSGQWQSLGTFTSQSEADLALCSQLAFWCQRDEAQMDRIFRTSGLMREKWDSRRGGSTYGTVTIQKACSSCTEVYERRASVKDSDIEVTIRGHKKNGTKYYPRTDTGNAARLKDKFGPEIKYSYNRKRWYYWTGSVWNLDETGQIKKFTDIILGDMKAEAYEIDDEKEREEFLKFVSSCGSSARKNAMVTETQHLDGIPILPSQFDSYPEFLNCQNGVVNLRNGELMPHSAELCMSRITNAEYSTVPKKPLKWISFLEDVCNGNKELVHYLQKCIGYSLSGSTKEQCVFFLYGLGNNGKSTMLDIIHTLLGGYAANAQPETIMAKRDNSGGSANSDIARLKSVRFVGMEEPSEGIRLNEGLVKQLTGGGKITCRFLFGDEFEYEPEFKLWMATNHKPTIRGTDNGIWRRIRLIPFEVNIPKEKVDKNLKYKLREEISLILRWAVEGYMLYEREGLEPPQCVVDATQEYKAEMDVLQSFCDACIAIDYAQPRGLYANDLYSAYSRWAGANNEHVMTSRRFFTEIAKKLPERKRDAKGIIYPSVKLLDSEQASATFAAYQQAYKN